MRQKVVWSLGRMMHSHLASCWARWQEATVAGRQDQLVSFSPQTTLLLTLSTFRRLRNYYGAPII